MTESANVLHSVASDAEVRRACSMPSRLTNSALKNPDSVPKCGIVAIVTADLRFIGRH